MHVLLVVGAIVALVFIMYLNSAIRGNAWEKHLRKNGSSFWD